MANPNKAPQDSKQQQADANRTDGKPRQHEQQSSVIAQQGQNTGKDSAAKQHNDRDAKQKPQQRQDATASALACSDWVLTDKRGGPRPPFYLLRK
ncbi:hypothetical protein Q9295_11345 [Xinfangfangia sp. CPCC 101601]|uniref:Uncharacterized protein n=1 Tax=Pseudogemmobacter lacusdianii TaxID=3069608 RepID=A0ABU0VYZ2_9RHOB|nr:hypothetical protein [Xinfangfangia sp. CPCC 101601]MDQ2066972.1 hypothetical protein [Xinfangfangia sp. CPCC 101601]